MGGSVAEHLPWGSGIEFHISLYLCLCLSLCVSHEEINKIFKKKKFYFGWITNQMTSRLAKYWNWKQQSWHLRSKNKNSTESEGERQEDLVEISS